MTTKRIKGQLHTATPFDPLRAGFRACAAPRHRRYAWPDVIEVWRQLTCRHAWTGIPVEAVGGGPDFIVARCPHCGLTGHS